MTEYRPPVSTVWNHLAVRALPYALIVFLCAYWMRRVDGDLFHLVASGRLAVRDGWPSLQDPFAYTATKPVWVDHEWLSAVLFYGVSQVGGDLSLFLLTCVLGYLTVLSLLWAQNLSSGRKGGCNPILFLSLFPCSFIWNSTIRPLTLSFFLFALLLALLELYRRTGRRGPLFALPVLFWIWGNAHGSFVVGLAFLGITCACRLVARMGAVDLPFLGSAIAALIATCVTPYGWHFIPFIVDAASMARPLVPEWSWTQLHLANAIFYGIGAVTVLTLGSGVRRGMPLEARLFLIVTFIAAIRHQRHVPYFLFTASVYLPASLRLLEADLSPFWRSRAQSCSRACCGMMWVFALFGLAQLAHFAVYARSFTLDYSRYPVETFAWLSRHAVGGRILVHFNNGSYVLFRGYPHFRVSIDARYEEAYPNETFERVLHALDPAHERHTAAFEEVSPDFILACRDTTRLADWSQFAEDWKSVFTGDGGRCSVFVKDLNQLSGAKFPKRSEHPWMLNF